jgi:uncharacterized oxidoreductase
MDLGGNTALVTGGASGIGLAIARRLLDAGSTVVVCGRRDDKLREAAERHPGLRTRVCDVGSEQERMDLFEWVTSELPRLNVVVNNAGIQRRISLTEPEPWAWTHEEIAINLDAAVHLSLLFLPHLLRQDGPAVVNVTSGLAFVPMASAPVYCATKAALHSFTLSLRHQLSGTPVRVIEVIPPAVNTELGGAGLHTFGTPLDEFADEVMRRMAAGEMEIAYGFAEERASAAREAFDDAFARMNGAPPRR